MPTATRPVLQGEMPVAIKDPPAQETPITSAAITKPHRDTAVHDDAAPGDMAKQAATGTTSTKFVPSEGAVDEDDDMEEIDFADIPDCGNDIETRKARVAALKKLVDTPDPDDVECVPANLAPTHPTVYATCLASTASHPCGNQHRRCLSAPVP